MQTRPSGTRPSPHATSAASRTNGSAVRRVVARAKVVQQVASGGIDVVSLLGVYVVLLMIVPSRIVLPGLGSIGTFANIYALMALMWLGASWLMRRVTPLSGTWPPRFAVGFFSIAVLLSYVAYARRGGTGLETNAADRGLIQLVAWISLVLLASSVRSEERLNKLLRLIVRCAAIIAVIGIIEFFLRRDILGWVQIPGLDATTVTLGSMTRGDFTRPYSTAIHPLEFATTLATILPFAIQQAFYRLDVSRLQRWLPVGLITIATLMTVSRTAVIGVAVALIVLVPTWSSQRRWPTFALLVVGLGMVKVAIPGLIGTLFALFSTLLNGGDSSTQARTGDYADVFGYVALTPWTGRGFGTFLPVLYRYTDNMYLLALVEMGVVGVLAIFVLMGTMLHCAGAGRRRFTEPRLRELGQSFTASAAVLLVCTATFDTLSFPQVSGLFFMLLGLSGVYLGLARQHQAAGWLSPAAVNPTLIPTPSESSR